MIYDELKTITTNSKYVTRHIVPFGFSPNGDVAVYNKICSTMNAKADLFVCCNDARNRDSDIYEYLYRLYDNTTENQGKSIGSIWKYQNNKKEYYIYDENPVEMVDGKWKANLYIKISDAGMYLMKTGIGMFWYELRYYKSIHLMQAIENVEVLGEKIKQGLDISDNSTCILELYPNDKTVNDCLTELQKPHASKEKIKIIRKLLLYFERKNALDMNTIITFQNMFKELTRPHYQICYADEQNKLHACLLGRWINRILSELDCAIEYFPGRIVDPEGSTFDEKKMTEYGVALPDITRLMMLPDKAILFNYIAIAESTLAKDKECVEDIRKDLMETIAYYLGLGYNGKYKVEQQVKDSMLHPYNNVVGFAKKEGFAECVTFTEDNKEFFINRKMQHMRTDYFHMYMNLLQQSYSILNMTKELSLELMADQEAYKDGDRVTSDKLEIIEARINLFLIKNVKASVSHVENQNVFYSYVEDSLHIKEDLSALNSGLKNLQEILVRRDSRLEQEKNDRMQIALTFLSIVAIPTLLKDFYEMYTDNDLTTIISSPLHLLTFIGVLILFIVVIRNSKDSLKELFKPSKK